MTCPDTILAKEYTRWILAEELPQLAALRREIPRLSIGCVRFQLPPSTIVLGSRISPLCGLKTTLNSVAPSCACQGASGAIDITKVSADRQSWARRRRVKGVLAQLRLGIMLCAG